MGQEGFDIFLQESAQTLGDAVIAAYEANKRVVNTASFDLGFTKHDGTESPSKKLRVTLVVEPQVFSDTIYPPADHDTSVTAIMRQYEMKSGTGDEVQ